MSAVQELLATFDGQVRRHPEADGSSRAESCAPVIRVVDPGAWSGVVWSDLDDSNADAVIARETEHFRGHDCDWEWKHYSYDNPLDLPERLRRAGLRAEPEEAVLVAEIASLDLAGAPSEAVTVVHVETRAEVEALREVERDVFGEDGPSSVEQLLDALGAQPPRKSALLALVEGRPVAAGRMDFCEGTDFALLFGGCTMAGFRRRGAYRALVAARARLAASRGFRYLQVDASAESEPILRRLGFIEIARTTPYVPRSTSG